MPRAVRLWNMLFRSPVVLGLVLAAMVVSGSLDSRGEAAIDRPSQLEAPHWLLPASDGAAQVEEAPRVPGKAGKHRKLASALQGLVTAGDQSAAAASEEAKKQGIETVKGSVVVVVETAQGKGTALQAKIQTLGGVIQRARADRLKVALPITALKAAADLEGVNFVHRPDRPHPEVVSQGVNTTSAASWHAAGLTGQGVKVAIVDLGFDGYEALLGSELPATVTAKSFRIDNDITGHGENHGTRVAQIVHDMAPGAQLYLVNIQDSDDLAAAVDWLIDIAQVDVINHSVGWFNTGPGDGTGPIGDIVTMAKTSGILWVNSAGNSAQRHWSGVFTDINGNGAHNYNGTDDEGNTISGLQGDLVIVTLRWDDWPAPGQGSTQDYDLYLVRSSNGDLVALSQNYQDDTPGQKPTESLYAFLPEAGNYFIVIENAGATRDVNFDLFSFNDNLEYQVPEGSIAMPADSLNVLAVGATRWDTNALEPFSSQGPNEVGDIRPDIAGPDCTSDSFSGAFCGTSGSAPHVAGAAALVLQDNPNLTPSELQGYLEFNAVDMGIPDKDNQFGAGRLKLESLGNLPVDVRLTKTDAPDPVVAGADLNYHLKVTNPATGSAVATHVGVTDQTGTFFAKLDALQERPLPTVPPGYKGTGVGTFTLNAARAQLAFNVTVDPASLTGPMTSAHFHLAPAGTPGGVVRNLFPDFGGGNTASGVWASTDASQPLTPALVTALLAGNLYVNIHTAANPSGEIRGQILPALTYSSHTSSKGTYNSATGVWDVGGLKQGQSATLDLLFAVNPGTPAGTIIVNTAEASADQEDSAPLNNTAATETTVVARPPELTAELSLHLHQDPADGAAGIVAGISQVNGQGGGIALKSFEAKLTYDANCLQVLGFRAMDFPIIAHDLTAPGVATFAGLLPDGVPAPADLGHVLTRLAGRATQPCALKLEVVALTNVAGNSILVPGSRELSLRRGDARADGNVDIADALFIAQYLVGLRPACTDNIDLDCLHSVNAASVRQDGVFDETAIADALFIAQYLVDLRDDKFNLPGG